MQNQTFGFIGLGLIGGSVAKALKKYHPDCKILACDKNEDALLLAKEEGICDFTCKEIDDSFYQCDYIFLCTPVSFNNEYLTTVKKYKNPDCIITDVGSVKGPIHETIRNLSLEHCFIGGHPMAGSEHSGYSFSNAGLLENAYYILTPEKKVPQNKVSAFFSLVSSFNAIPLVLDEQYHDYVTAAVSHLPHMLAFSLVNLIKDSDNPDGVMKMIAAGGFKDITRIASSSPVMWQQICSENKQPLLTMMDDYIKALSLLRQKIAEEDTDFLYHYFDSAKDYRDSFNSVINGPIGRSYHVSLYVPDEAGAIAEISGLFAKENISIKNIGILHSREYEEGALRIEFYDEFSLNNACKLLKEKQYHIYTK